MGGTVVTGDAFELLQINIDQINPNFYRRLGNDADVNYAEMNDKIWEMLEMHYGHTDKVIEFTNRLKSFKQTHTMSTLEYLSKFKRFMNELKLEIKIRNEVKKVYVELTKYEYSKILIANSRPEVMEFVIKQAVDNNDGDNQIDLKQAMLYFEKYARIERIRSNAIGNVIMRDNNNYKTRKLYQLDAEINNDETNDNDDELEVNAIRSRPYCYNGTRARCNKEQCMFAHFPDDANIAIIIKYFAKFNDKWCNKRDKCKMRNCPFKHTLARRKEIGLCKFDGRCARKKCIYYHKKQDNDRRSLN